MRIVIDTHTHVRSMSCNHASVLCLLLDSLMPHIARTGIICCQILRGMSRVWSEEISKVAVTCITIPWRLACKENVDKADPQGFDILTSLDLRSYQPLGGDQPLTGQALSVPVMLC